MTNVSAVSVVIPAHNEEQVIGRCLANLVDGAEAGEFDIVVVTNGCTDRTAMIAAGYPGVRVVDSPVASKIAALNLGDQMSDVFPRLYVDADVVVDAAAIRAVGALLAAGEVELAAPDLEFDFSDRPWTVRAWYSVWQRLPYGADNHVGTGFYGMSEAGRARFGQFPDTMAEDFFVWATIPASARRAVHGHRFVVHPPLTLRALLRIQIRMQAANARNRSMFSSASTEVRSGQTRSLLRLARDPRLVPAVALYTASSLVAKAVAAWKNRTGRTNTWERDETARAAAT